MHPSPKLLVGIVIALHLGGCAQTGVSRKQDDRPPYLPYSQDFDCADFTDNFGKLTLQRLRISDGGCEIAVKPSEIRGDRFRTYLFSSAGAFTVFNSYGKGMGSANNAMRSYFIFPRTAPPTIAYPPGSEGIEVRIPAEVTFRFSLRTGRLENVTGGIRFTEDPELSRKNRGGVELLSYPGGLILDTGWRHGGIAHQDLSRESEFIDRNGKRCAVRNGEIFKLVNREPYLKFETDQELVPFLETRCPDIDLSPFRD